MALETLKNIFDVNNHKVKHIQNGEVPEFDGDIVINHDENTITFKIQKGVIKENGHNGCQVDELISTALLMVKGLNVKRPHTSNVGCVTALYEAYSWLQQRKIERELRGVEGTDQV